MSDSLDTGEKKLEALADVLEEAMPKLSYDQRNVAYVNYLYETGALDDPHNLGHQIYLQKGELRETGQQSLIICQGGTGAAEAKMKDENKYNLQLTAKEREDLVQGVSRWYGIKAKRLLSIRNTKGAIIRGHKASVKKAKKAYQKAHKDFHDYVGDIEEWNALKRLMNKAKKELASLEGKTPDIKKLEVEARKLNRLLGKKSD